MQQNTVRLSKPERLKIKKKITLLMKTKFNIKNESSPALKQYRECRMNYRYVIPFPYGMIRLSGNHAHAVNPSDYCGIPKQRMKNVYVFNNDGNSRYSLDYYMPSSVKMFTLKEDSEEQYTLGNIKLILENSTCVLTAFIVPPNTAPDDYYLSFNRRSKITLRYKPEKKKLQIKTTLDNEDYDAEHIRDVIKMILYNLISY